MHSGAKLSLCDAEQPSPPPASLQHTARLPHQLLRQLLHLQVFPLLPLPLPLLQKQRLLQQVEAPLPLHLEAQRKAVGDELGTTMTLDLS